MSLDCSSYREKLSAYFDNQLSAAEKSEVESHLRSCLSCRTLLEKFGRLEDLGRLSSLRFDADFEDSMAGGIEEAIESLPHGKSEDEIGGEDDRQSKPRKIIPLWHRYAAIAASVVFVILIGRMALEEAKKPLTKPSPVYLEPTTVDDLKLDAQSEQEKESRRERKGVILKSATIPNVDSEQQVGILQPPIMEDINIPAQFEGSIEPSIKSEEIKTIPMSDSQTDLHSKIGIPKPVAEIEKPKEDRGDSRQPQQAASPVPEIKLRKSPGVSTISVPSDKVVSKKTELIAERSRNLVEKGTPIESEIDDIEASDESVAFNMTGTVGVAPKPPSRLEERYLSLLAQHTASKQKKETGVEMTLKYVTPAADQMKTGDKAGDGVEGEQPLRDILNNKRGEESDDPDQRVVDLYIQLRAWYDLYLKTSNERHLDYSIQLRDSILNILAKPDRVDLPARFIDYHQEVAGLKLKRK